MSAPKDAYRIGDYFISTPLKWEVHCPCGWHGTVDDLLGVDYNNTLWCPQCQGTGWVYS